MYVYQQTAQEQDAEETQNNPNKHELKTQKSFGEENWTRREFYPTQDGIAEQQK